MLSQSKHMEKAETLKDSICLFSETCVDAETPKELEPFKKLRRVRWKLSATIVRRVSWVIAMSHFGWD